MSAISGTASPLARQVRRFTATSGLTLLAIVAVSAFLMPLAYMVTTAFKDQSQLTTVGAPLYPAAPETFDYNGETLDVYDVPTEDGQVHAWALVQGHREDAIYIDPENIEAGEITWVGRWRHRQWRHRSPAPDRAGRSAAVLSTEAVFTALPT